MEINNSIIEQMIKDHQDRIKDMKEDIKDYRDRIKDMKEDIKDYQDRIKDMKEDIKDYRDIIKDMKEEIKQYIHEKKDLQELLRNKENQAQMIYEDSRTKNQIDQYEDIIKSMKDQITAHLADKEHLKALLSKKEQEQQIKQKDTQIKELIEDKEQNQNQINILNTDKRDLETVISKIKQEHKQQLEIKDSEINGLIKQNQDFKTKIKNQYQQMKKDLKDLKKDIRGLCGEGEDIKGFIKKQYYELKQEVEKKQQQFSKLVKQTSDTNMIKVAQQLRQCKNEVHVKEYSKLDKYKKQIKEYEQNSKQYRIVVDFRYYPSAFPSLDSKMEVLRMIDTMNANSNVGNVWITLTSTNRFNDEIVTMMMNKYINAYRIAISDWNNQVDDTIHDIIKQWVIQSPIIVFVLYFSGGSLWSNSDGLKLMKQYNQLIKSKQYLEVLWYNHQAIDGSNDFDTKQKIQELIIRVDKS